jgi:signal transduction histidine kinase
MARLHTVRFRATIGATLIVAIALAIAGLLLVNVLRQSQLDAVDRNLESRALDIEGLIDGGAALSTLTVESDESGFVQVLGTDDTVIASSANVDGAPALTTQQPPWRGSQAVAQFDAETFRVGAFATDGAAARTIIVGRTLAEVERTMGVLIGALAVGLPLLLILIAALVWLVVGRALGPVESMRREVDDIGGGDLHRRLPEPLVHDEVGRLANTMNALLERVEAANLAQARFVSDASHELRTPISVIRHELEVALRSTDDSDWRRTAGEVLDEDLRMQRLVDDLLFLARTDRADGVTAPDAHRLVDLDDVVLDESRRVHTTKTIDTTKVSAGQVRGDVDKLGRIVRNLLDNALRHSRTTVALRVDSVDGQVRLRVEDDGGGVAEADRARIFERFGRVDDARSRRDGGSGLGLAIVRELVAEHGGMIEVDDSEQFGGARFTVALPDART